MTTLQLFQWIENNQPTPYEIRMLYKQLNKELTKDEAWWIYYVQGVRCSGPGSGGYSQFVKELTKAKLLP